MVSETFVANGATRIAHGEKRMYTRIQDRSVDEIAARANQYLEGESGAEEFRKRLLRAIAHADGGRIDLSRQGHRRQRRRDGLKTGRAGLSVSLNPVSVPRALSLLAAPAAAQWDHGFPQTPETAWLGAYGWGLNGFPHPSGRGQRVSRSRGRILADVMELTVGIGLSRNAG
jgi:hypothetical protein